MSEQLREVYLISDLHLGGVPLGGGGDGRGFRICTHGSEIARFITTLAEKPLPIELVVNGDMVDFLAEENEDGGWAPFTANQHSAVRKLDAIIDRDREVFAALRTLLERGHRLTLLLGNHDIELALPAVRRRLTERIGIAGRHDFHFIYDGEAYVVGRALIEHGNRYDRFNVVDYDGLRRLRSLLSRNQPIPPERVFKAPAGSHMVAEVINPIKADYRLVDLLKPETEAAVPVLLALEPGYRSTLARVVALRARAQRHGLTAAALPAFAGDIAAHTAEGWEDGVAANISSSGDLPDSLTAIVRETMKDEADVLLKAVAVDQDFAGDISAGDTITRALGIARLLSARSREGLESRLPALLAAVRALQDDRSFARDTESLTEYLDAASDLACNGFDCIIFGHTHLARDIELPTGGRYLNLGTWADLIRFPSEILRGSKRQALDGLRAFVEDMKAGRLRAWTSFAPTYGKLTLREDGSVCEAAVFDSRSPADV